MALGSLVPREGVEFPGTGHSWQAQCEPPAATPLKGCSSARHKQVPEPPLQPQEECEAYVRPAVPRPALVAGPPAGQREPRPGALTPACSPPGTLPGGPQPHCPKPPAFPSAEKRGASHVGPLQIPSTERQSSWED